MSNHKELRIANIVSMIQDHFGLDSINAQVLAEDFYDAAHGEHTPPNETEERINELFSRLSSVESKQDTMSEKLDKVAKRLG